MHNNTVIVNVIITNCSLCLHLFDYVLYSVDLHDRCKTNPVKYIYIYIYILLR